MKPNTVRTIIVIIALVITAVLVVVGPRMARNSAIQKALGELPSEFPTDRLVTLTDDEHRQGPKDAKVTIVEYSDLECPFCHRAHPIIQNIVEKYDSVAWVYRHYPLPNHTGAYPKAIVTECVARDFGNDAFWSVTNAYMTGSETDDALATINKTPADIADCITDPSIARLVDTDIKTAEAAKTQGTPNFVIVGPNKEQVHVPGLPKTETLEALIIHLSQEQ